MNFIFFLLCNWNLVPTHSRLICCWGSIYLGEFKQRNVVFFFQITLLKFVIYFDYIYRGAMFILMAFTAKRGREGIDFLKRDHFKKLYDEDLDLHYYAQIITCGSKNHKRDNQKISGDEGRWGVIPFEYDDYGISPGRWLEMFLALGNPENKYFFQQPSQPDKPNKRSTFDIHDPETKILYTKGKVGKNFVAQMLPELSRILGLPHLTNAQVRSSTIRRMKRDDHGDRDVMEVCCLL